MADTLEIIKSLENQIEEALWALEVHEELDKALEVYQAAEQKLTDLDLGAVDPAYSEQQRVLAYCLMRQGNLLRQMDKSAEAFVLSERELAAARLSEDQITLARSLMSSGTNFILTRKIEQGLALLEEARLVFEKGDSYDHRQGLGWYWILQADLANADIIDIPPPDVIKTADRALEILMPIQNWPGVARAYAARAQAHEALKDKSAAARDRQEQQVYERKTESGEIP